MTCAIEFQDVHFAYQEGSESLRGISSAVKKGDNITLVGPNEGRKNTSSLCT